MLRNKQIVFSILLRNNEIYSPSPGYRQLFVILLRFHRNIEGLLGNVKSPRSSQSASTSRQVLHLNRPRQHRHDLQFNAFEPIKSFDPYTGSAEQRPNNKLFILQVILTQRLHSSKL